MDKNQGLKVKVRVDERVYVIEADEARDVDLDLGGVKVSIFDARNGTGPDL